MYTQKLYGDDSCTSQLQSLAEDLQLAGVERQRDGKLRSSGERETDGKDLPVCTCVCVAPPMIVGVWWMAVVLWQLLQFIIQTCEKPDGPHCMFTSFIIWVHVLFRHPMVLIF